MEVTAKDVMKLRQATGAGPVECKKALTEANGDFEAATKLLKEKGLAAVEKRADRATNEGRIFLKSKGEGAGNMVAMVEIDSETDFVAKNPEFIALGGQIAQMALDEGIGRVEPRLSEMVTELATKIREKMELKHVKLITAGSDGYVSAYVHGDGQNLGVSVTVTSDKPEIFSQPGVQEFVHNLALHVAAFNPKAVQRSDLSNAFMNEQQDIFAAQMKNDPKMAGKPEAALGKILEGKMHKYLADICFVDQAYVKDDKITVAKAIEECERICGAKLKIKDFVYFKVGAE
jgi:elongation factor Ts